MSEAQIQQEIIKYFNNKYCLKSANQRCLIFAVPNEAAYKNKSIVGLMPGVSDLIVVMPGVVLFVELKAEKGKQSDAQKVFQGRIERIGHFYAIVRSLSDFITLVDTIISEKKIML